MIIEALNKCLLWFCYFPLSALNLPGREGGGVDGRLEGGGGGG